MKTQRPKDTKKKLKRGKNAFLQTFSFLVKRRFAAQFSLKALLCVFVSSGLSVGFEFDFVFTRP